MSEARRLPGQSILERLGARGIQRPQLGASPGFYERFGLADPWTVEERWIEDNSDSPFYFLSAAPYYARLKAMSREARARRRILDRLEAEPFAVRGFAARMNGGIAAALPARASLSRGFGIPSVDLGSLTSLDPAASASLFFEQQEEEQAPARRASQPYVAATSSRGAWAVRKQLAELAPLARTEPQRRALKRAVEEIELLPEKEQVHAARRIVRRIKGPASRIATAVVERTVEHVDAAPAAVARTRALPHIGKGLRRILGTTPSMATLAQDIAPEPTQSVSVRASRTREVEAVRPSAAPVTVARAVREARAQLQTGRAGPPAEVAELGRTPAAGPVRVPRRRPTARAMARTLAAPTTPSIDIRRGLQASVPAPVATTRVAQVARAAERSQAGVRVDAVGTPFVAPSVTSYVAPQSSVREDAARPVRVRRSRAVREEPSSWLRPGAAEPETVEVARPAARVAARAEAAPRAVRVAGSETASAPLATAIVRVAGNAPIVTPPAARAALRAEPVQRRDVAGRALLSPAPVAHV
ncbi:MAG: hypothetical protein EP330_07575, partial [Deltaproteobacteria bacterium]